MLLIIMKITLIVTLLVYITIAIIYNYFSSSWDSTAKVWNLNNPRASPLTLKGHQAAVWAVIDLGNGTYATASADKTIKLWKKDGSVISTLSGNKIV